MRSVCVLNQVPGVSYQRILPLGSMQQTKVESPSTTGRSTSGRSPATVPASSTFTSDRRSGKEAEDNLRTVFRLADHRSRGYDRSYALRRLAVFERDEAFLGKATAQLSGGEAEIIA